MKRWTLNVAVAAVVMMLVGGARAQDKQPEAGKAGGEPKVTLQDAGAEPRKPLRYSLAKGSKSTLTMTMQMSMGQNVAGMQLPATKIPPMEMVMDVHVVEVQPGGDAKYEFVLSNASIVEEPGVNPMIMNMMKKSLTSMIGMTGSAVVTARGFTRDVKLDAPPNADPATKNQVESMRQSMNQFAAPLPEEAVGQGAKWNVDTEVSTGGITMQQRAVMTLAKIEGDVIDLNVELTQTAEEQDVKHPDLPPNAKVRLMSMSSKGSGKTKLRLTQTVPVEAEMSNASDQALVLSGPNMEQEMKQQIEMTMKMKEGAPPPKDAAEPKDNAPAPAKENGPPKPTTPATAPSKN